MQGDATRRAVWHVTVTVERGGELRCRIASTRDVDADEAQHEVAIGVDEACASLRRFLEALDER